MKAGRILKLAGLNYVNNVAEQHRNAAIETLNKINDAADSFNEDFAAVAADAKLTPEGRAESSVKVASAALARLASVDDVVKTLTERASALEATLLAKASSPAPKDPAERIAHENHLREVRDQLRQLPLVERTNVYRTSTDPLVLAAIETAPMTLSATRPDGSQKLEPFIDPEQMSAAKLERAERADPTTAQTLRDLRSLREVYSHAVNSVRNEILDEVPGATPALAVRT